MMTDELYKEIIDNLHIEIQVQHQYVKRYTEKYGMDRHYLANIFAGRQDMSVGMFLRLCYDLKMIEMLKPEHNITLSLKQYMKINHTDVMNCVMAVHTR